MKISVFNLNGILTLRGQMGNLECIMHNTMMRMGGLGVVDVLRGGCEIVLNKNIWVLTDAVF